jgi:SlyX protein
MEKLEENIAHLTRTVEDLSDKQEGEIDTLTRRVFMLMQREGERDSGQGGGVVVGDERPPHY